MPNRSFEHISVKEGATITRIYYAVPTLYSIGEEFDTRIDALRAAIKLTEERTTQSQFASQHVVFDERWVISTPGIHSPSTGLDTVLKRTEYKTLDEARHMLELAERYPIREDVA